MINKAGIDLIKKWEGFKADAYLCPAGVLTIGYGFTKGVKKGDKMTREQADIRLIEELKTYEGCVRKVVNVPISENELAALTSFTFNLGCGALQKSTLLKKLNTNDRIGASKEFIKWSKAGGKTLEGLVKRRLEETDLFLKNK
jgi:lysozyme